MKLIIYAGQAFSADFIVVSDDGTTGQELDPSDYGTFEVHSTGPEAKIVIPPVPMTVVDTTNGTFNIALTAEQTSLLSPELGFQEDHYSPISNYLGYLDFTLVSGNRQATVPVYVEAIAQWVPET